MPGELLTAGEILRHYYSCPHFNVTSAHCDSVVNGRADAEFSSVRPTLHAMYITCSNGQEALDAEAVNLID